MTKLHSICNEVGTEELIGRVYPFIVKIYQRCTNSGAIPRTRTAKLSLVCMINAEDDTECQNQKRFVVRRFLFAFGSVDWMNLKQAILQFFLDYGDLVLHDFDLSLRTFFRSHLSR